MDLKGKNVVHVGALGLGGVGLETSKLLMTKQLGSYIILDALKDVPMLTELRAIDPKCNVMFLKFDITNKESIQDTINEVADRVRYIDVLINGVGILSDRDVNLTINVNLIGLIHTTMAALPYISLTASGRGGLILNVASIAGIEPAGSFAVYSAAKFGVIGFTRSLAHEYYYHYTDVAMTAICPGMVDNPMGKFEILGRDTFQYSRGMTERLLKAESQSQAVFAEHIVEVIEKRQNDSVWISDLGKLTFAEPKLFWEPTYK